jgi:radical SAM superfamily enzyme YgiQ (UPF0313 family)
MQNVKVLLMIPPGEFYVSANAIFPPLGIAYIGAYLENKGVKVLLKDFFAEKKNVKDVIKYISDEHPDIVGVSIVTDNRFDAFSTVREIKRNFPSILIVAGGPHITLATEDTMKNIPEIDIAVVNEGEITFYEITEAFCENKKFENISGIFYKKDGAIVRTAPRPLINNLDELPFPAFHLLDIKKYESFILIDEKERLFPAINLISSRGCPINCNFCSNTRLWGGKNRLRTPENFVGEIEFLMNRYGYKNFIFYDDTLNIDFNRLQTICDLIICKNLNISWSCAIRVDQTSPDMLKKMKEAGCRVINFGVESGNYRIREKIIHKKISGEQIFKADREIFEAGIKGVGSFIVGSPGETKEEALETLEMMKNLKSTPLINIVRVYPGTQLENYCRKNGLIPKDFSWANEGNLEKIAETFPGLYGKVPILTGKMTWAEIGDILIAWSKMNKSFPLWKAGFIALKNVRSTKDLLRIIKILLSYLRLFLNPDK